MRGFWWQSVRQRRSEPGTTTGRGAAASRADRMVPTFDEGAATRYHQWLLRLSAVAAYRPLVTHEALLSAAGPRAAAARSRADAPGGSS
jgi:hypothetical protein